MKTEKKIHKSVKIPESLHKKIKNAALKDGRTYHGFLIWALKKIIEQNEKQTK